MNSAQKGIRYDVTVRKEKLICLLAGLGESTPAMSVMN